MKRSLVLIVFVTLLSLVMMTTGLEAAKPGQGMLEYKVKAIDANNWVITATETKSGNEVKFRLPPSVFKGQTFDAEVQSMKRGQRFSVKGPRNAQLGNMVVEKPLPGNRPGGMALPKGLRPAPTSPLTWEILNVNPRKWVVSAKNRRSGKVMRFQVHPEALIGFVFKADLRGVKKGQGFAMVTPNDVLMSNCCTFMNLK